MIAERLESMSPNGFLRLMRQEDGDIIVTVGESDNDDGFKSFSTIEFCTPFAGGGGSRRTYAALVQLIAAMAADNLDGSQAGRRPPGVDMESQQRLVEWGRQCRQAEAELRSQKLYDSVRCPVCNSPSPELHPAVQHEGEVQVCRDIWHS